MIPCRDRGEILTQNSRVMKSVSKKGKQYYLNRCRPCISESDMLLRQLKKAHPMLPSGAPCECCGRIDKLFYDHDHATKTFRGFCCRSCNSAIGMLGYTEAGLKQALAYLERMRTNSRSRSTNDNKTHDNDCGETECVKVAFCRSDHELERSENMPTHK